MVVSGLRTYLEGANGPGRGSQVHSHDVLVFLWMSVVRRRAWCSYLSISISGGNQATKRGVSWWSVRGKPGDRQTAGRKVAGTQLPR